MKPVISRIFLKYKNTMNKKAQKNILCKNKKYSGGSSVLTTWSVGHTKPNNDHVGKIEFIF